MNLSSLNNLFFSLSNKEKILFARHIEMMTRSGMQLLNSLEILKTQTKSKPFIDMLDHLIMDLKNGHFLSVGLERYKHVFGEFFINLIRVGEQSGTLTDNLRYLADEIAKKEELNKKIKGAMIYPIVILVATLGIAGILTFFIFPKILPVLKSLKVQLPASTLAFIAISNFLFNYGHWLALGLVVLFIAFTIAIRAPKIRFIWHRVILRLPAVANMSRAVNLVNFSRTTNLLLRGGVQIVEALNITSDTLTNVVYRKAVKEVATSVQKGEPMSKILSANGHLFPPTFSQMVMVGENTGKLDETLQFLGEFYEGELDEATKNLTSILEPLLMLTMGLVVGFIAVSIITPIYKISQTLGR